jgi:hypothetical protein
MSDGGFGHQHVPRNQRRLRSILALDKQIIQLKRSRNSLLNVARIPPEVLGHISRFNVKPKASDGPFAGLGERSHNFLRVCHHWSEVSRRTPELWSFWGNSLEDWERQCPHSGPYLLDLVLDGVEHRDGGFDGGLQDVLRDCAGRGAIRKVHLRDDDLQLLTDIISTLTPGRWYPRQRYRINRSGTCGCSPFPPPPRRLPTTGVDASDFFCRHRFPNLRDLSLSGRFTISSSAWDCPKSHTMALTNLSLSLDPPSSILTTSRILSLLASNPNIQSLTQALSKINNDSKSNSKSRVQLHHLKELTLTGEPHRVFRRMKSEKSSCRTPEITSVVIQGSRIGWGFSSTSSAIASCFELASPAFGITVRINCRNRVPRIHFL